jgi:hypothetical protein
MKLLLQKTISPVSGLQRYGKAYFTADNEPRTKLENEYRQRIER